MKKLVINTQTGEITREDLSQAEIDRRTADANTFNSEVTKRKARKRAVFQKLQSAGFTKADIRGLVELIQDRSDD